MEGESVKGKERREGEYSRTKPGQKPDERIKCLDSTCSFFPKHECLTEHELFPSRVSKSSQFLKESLTINDISSETPSP